MQNLIARVRQRYWPSYVFVHINKTGGSSIERALGLNFAHLTAREYIDRLGRNRWSRAFTFAFVRNPWDKVVSHYHYRVQTNQTGMGDGHIDFKSWVRASYGDRDPRYYDQPRMFMPQRHWIEDEHGQVAVDFVGKFEQLADDFAVVCRNLGVRRELPHLKRSERGDFRKYYDDETAQVVAERFDPDLREFGYQFDAAPVHLP